MNIKREKYVINASDQVLGRLASKVSTLLRGKHKPDFVPYLDMGDFVTVTNAAKVKITGKKAIQKKYIRHSGFPGGLSSETFDKLMEKDPPKIIKHAVWGMLPKNKLGKASFKKLAVFKGEPNG